MDGKLANKCLFENERLGKVQRLAEKRTRMEEARELLMDWKKWEEGFILRKMCVLCEKDW
jgi:hypothetical protein